MAIENRLYVDGKLVHEIKGQGISVGDTMYGYKIKELINSVSYKCFASDGFTFTEYYHVMDFNVEVVSKDIDTNQ